MIQLYLYNLYGGKKVFGAISVNTINNANTRSAFKKYDLPTIQEFKIRFAIEDIETQMIEVQTEINREIIQFYMQISTPNLFRIIQDGINLPKITNKDFMEQEFIFVKNMFILKSANLETFEKLQKNYSKNLQNTLDVKPLAVSKLSNLCLYKDVDGNTLLYLGHVYTGRNSAKKVALVIDDFSGIEYNHQVKQKLLNNEFRIVEDLKLIDKVVDVNFGKRLTATKKAFKELINDYNEPNFKRLIENLPDRFIPEFNMSFRELTQAVTLSENNQRNYHYTDTYKIDSAFRTSDFSLNHIQSKSQLLYFYAYSTFCNEDVFFFITKNDTPKELFAGVSYYFNGYSDLHNNYLIS